MNRVGLIVILVLLIVQGVSSSDEISVKKTASSSLRSLWDWDQWKPYRTEDNLLDFCIQKGISIIYFSTDLSQPERLRNLIKKAHDKGISVEALSGDGNWALTKNHDKVLYFIDELLKFNQQGNQEQRFDGLQLDVEPYCVTAEWCNPDGTRSLEREINVSLQYLDMVEKVAKRLKDASSKMVFGLAIPFWYEQATPPIIVEWRGTKKAVSYHLLDMVDYVAVMSYRRFAEGEDGTIALAKHEIEYASKIGKKVYVGQETGEVPDISFRGTDEKTLEGELAKIENAFAKHPGFGGIAIHFYRTYRELVTGEDLSLKEEQKIVATPSTVWSNDPAGTIECQDTEEGLEIKYKLNQYQYAQIIKDCQFDISGGDYIKFKYKGEGNNRNRLEIALGDGKDNEYRLKVGHINTGQEWKEITIPYANFGKNFDKKNVAKIVILVCDGDAGNSGTLVISNVKYYNQNEEKPLF